MPETNQNPIAVPKPPSNSKNLIVWLLAVALLALPSYYFIIPSFMANKQDKPAADQQNTPDNNLNSNASGEMSGAASEELKTALIAKNSKITFPIQTGLTQIDLALLPEGIKVLLPADVKNMIIQKAGYEGGKEGYNITGVATGKSLAQTNLDFGVRARAEGWENAGGVRINNFAFAEFTKGQGMLRVILTPESALSSVFEIKILSE